MKLGAHGAHGAHGGPMGSSMQNNKLFSFQKLHILKVRLYGRRLQYSSQVCDVFDVSEETHPLYHPGEDGKVDYKNRLAAIKDMPSTATFDERMAALTIY